ncbi:hypothetical protein [Phaeacidiphilus oryzae]|uniref:hypothetical protein n=1 Tax=Phaeacidiphilus oryzae TaxID=348818 RepID=UPI00068ADD8A|nr:hypothetical protein [Phaeacidiphilus oryzae]
MSTMHQPPHTNAEPTPPSTAPPTGDPHEPDGPPTPGDPHEPGGRHNPHSRRRNDSPESGAPLPAVSAPDEGAGEAASAPTGAARTFAPASPRDRPSAADPPASAGASGPPEGPDPPAAQHAPRSLPAPPPLSADVTGLLLLVACASWVVYCSAGRDARPEDPLIALLAATAGFAVGRIAGAVRPAAAPAAAGLALAVLAALAAFVPALTGSALAPDAVPAPAVRPSIAASPPTAALSALAVALLCLAALRADRWAARRALFLVALLTTAQLALTAGLSPGTIAAVGTVLVCAAGVRARHRLGGILLLGTLGAAIAAGALLTARQGLLPAWHPAYAQLAAHPLRGLGPGLLDSPTAVPALLRAGAQLGLPGLLLLGAAYVWGQYALLLAPAPAPQALTGAAALTFLAVEAATADALTTPLVAAATGLLLGLTTARPEPPPAAPR